MANENGNGKKKSRKSRPINYFYLNGLLHKKLHINRAADIITAWCYPEHRRVAYTYSDMRKRMGKAFTTVEAGKLLGRSRLTLERAILNGDIEEPQFTYGLNEAKKKYKYMWSEEDILAMHAFLLTVHRGRPRKDGLITNSNIPSARELRAMIRHNEIIYVKRGDRFVPTWEAEDF